MINSQKATSSPVYMQVYSEFGIRVVAKHDCREIIPERVALS